MMFSDQPFSAVILAADRGFNDPVAQSAAVSCKALTPVSGRAMVLRVLDALAEAQEVGVRILAGPAMASVEQNAELHSLISSGQVCWFTPQATPSSSAFSVLQALPDDVPVLVTTADHALLTAAMVDHFCSKARNSGCDVLAGVARHDLVAVAFPESRRTVTRLKDGGYCGCNLFAFLTPKARLAADFWKKVEKERKKPLRIVKVMGTLAVLRYLLRQLTLDQALAKLSQRMGMKVGVIQMPFAEAAVDVDKVDDWLLVESILAKKNQRAPLEEGVLRCPGVD
jgi:GTP:adenosylcobinamide-phosphate guanylyltransferase